jgi:hypothetical protein
VHGDLDAATRRGELRGVADQLPGGERLRQKTLHGFRGSATLGMSRTVDVIDRDVEVAGALVRVSGEIDVRTCVPLEAMPAPLPTGGVCHLLVDACALRFCDVAGTRVPQGLHTRLRAAADR